MATIDAPFGFRPIGATGGPYTGSIMKCAVGGGITTNVLIGDLVVLAGGGTTAGTLGSTETGLPTVIAATAGTGNPIFGAVVGFGVNPSNLESQFALGTDANDRVCFVAPAMDGSLFIAQEDGATDVLTVADIGSTIAFVATAGNTIYGQSGYELDSNTTSAAATEQFRIVGLYQDPDNELNTGTTAGTIWIVTPNEAQLGTGVVTVGV